MLNKSMHQSFFSPSKSRTGFTLLEVLLVLAIIAALAGMAVPTLDSMVTSRRVYNSGERLANLLMEARTEAMKTGQAQVFHATLNGSEFTIAPWMGTYDDIDASAGATVQDSTGAIVETEAASGGGVSTSATTLDAEVQELEKGVQFMAVETMVDTRNAAAIESETGVVPMAGATPASADGSSSPILLYPDGTSTTGQIVLVDERGRRVVVQLRGVTGKISMFRTSGVDPSTVASNTNGASP